MSSPVLEVITALSSSKLLLYWHLRSAIVVSSYCFDFGCLCTRAGHAIQTELRWRSRCRSRQRGDHWSRRKWISLEAREYLRAHRRTKDSTTMHSIFYETIYSTAARWIWLSTRVKSRIQLKFPSRKHTIIHKRNIILYLIHCRKASSTLFHNLYQSSDYTIEQTAELEAHPHTSHRQWDQRTLLAFE